MPDSPTDDVLLAVGRITLTSSRLDHALTQLWITLDRTARGKRIRGGKGIRTRIRRLAIERLTGHLLDELLQAVDTAEDLARTQHTLLHQDWALAGSAGSAGPAGEPRRSRHWRQAPDGLSRWRPAASPAPAAPPPGSDVDVLASLQQLHAHLSELTDRIGDLTCGVARARDLGDPPDWDGPAPRGQRLRATYTVVSGHGGDHLDSVVHRAHGLAHSLVLTLPETGQRHSRVLLEDPRPPDDLHQPEAPSPARALSGVGETSPSSTWTPSRSRELREWSGWYRLLPWASPVSTEPMSTDVLDRALQRAGWHRVMPWTHGVGSSLSTSVERLPNAGAARD
ncbi:hypothetical protein [Kineococcus radiotolerans]|uniref:hypothetical protein n=1 Tax=Kineococcus radiotolerans TaxID=131568 RepID=UPI00003A3BB5|nr:hypothetical protein [Kineococcus radiotolerans]